MIAVPADAARLIVSDAIQDTDAQQNSDQKVHGGIAEIDDKALKSVCLNSSAHTPRYLLVSQKQGLMHNDSGKCCCGIMFGSAVSGLKRPAKLRTNNSSACLQKHQVPPLLAAHCKQHCGLKWHSTLEIGSKLFGLKLP